MGTALHGIGVGYLVLHFTFATFRVLFIKDSDMYGCYRSESDVVVLSQ